MNNYITYGYRLVDGYMRMNPEPVSYTHLDVYKRQHRDIAFEFASWISAEFKLYIITDYQRLKTDENSRLSLDVYKRQQQACLFYKIFEKYY